MNKINQSVLIFISLLLFSGCQTIQLGTSSSSNIVKDAPTSQYGKIIIFGNQRVNIQNVKNSETYRFAFEGKEVEVVRETAGEIAHLYRNDGRVSNLDVYSFVIEMKIGGKSNKFAQNGSRSSPLVQVAMFYDTSDEFEMADVKLGRNLSKGQQIPEEMADTFGGTFGTMFEGKSLIAGQRLRIGDSDSKFTHQFSRTFGGALKQLEKLDSNFPTIEMTWNPRLEFLEDGKAIFQCRREEETCLIEIKGGANLSGKATCDARFAVSIEYSVIVHEAYFCKGWADFNGKRISGMLQSELSKEVVR